MSRPSCYYYAIPPLLKRGVCISIAGLFRQTANNSDLPIRRKRSPRRRRWGGGHRLGRIRSAVLGDGVGGPRGGFAEGALNAVDLKTLNRRDCRRPKTSPREICSKISFALVGTVIATGAQFIAKLKMITPSERLPCLYLMGKQPAAHAAIDPFP